MGSYFHVFTNAADVLVDLCGYIHIRCFGWRAGYGSKGFGFKAGNSPFIFITSTLALYISIAGGKYSPYLLLLAFCSRFDGIGFYKGLVKLRP